MTKTHADLVHLYHSYRRQQTGQTPKLGEAFFLNKNLAKLKLKAEPEPKHAKAKVNDSQAEADKEYEERKNFRRLQAI